MDERNREYSANDTKDCQGRRVCRLHPGHDRFGKRSPGHLRDRQLQRRQFFGELVTQRASFDPAGREERAMSILDREDKRQVFADRVHVDGNCVC